MTPFHPKSADLAVAIELGEGGDAGHVITNYRYIFWRHRRACRKPQIPVDAATAISRVATTRTISVESKSQQEPGFGFTEQKAPLSSLMACLRAAR
jgi:hypothetical protein